MRKTIYPGYTTTGIVVENETAERVNADRVKVRIYELHGAPSNYPIEDTSISEDFTPDDELPWTKVVIPQGFNLSAKVLIYYIGAVVYVKFPSGNPEDGLVVGQAMPNNKFNITGMSGFYRLLMSQGMSGNMSIATGTQSTINLAGVGNNKVFYNPVVDAAGNSLSGLYVSSGYGMRTLNGNPNFHTGIDLTGVGENVNVYASRDGVVIATCSSYPPDTFDENSYGNYVLIDHGEIDGHHYYTRYAHLNEVHVSVGQTVSGICGEGAEGQKSAQSIGLLGNTGCSYGAHLHFEVLVDGTNGRVAYAGPADNAVDPLLFISI